MAKINGTPFQSIWSAILGWKSMAVKYEIVALISFHPENATYSSEALYWCSVFNGELIPTVDTKKMNRLAALILFLNYYWKIFGTIFSATSAHPWPQPVIVQTGKDQVGQGPVPRRTVRPPGPPWKLKLYLCCVKMISILFCPSLNTENRSACYSIIISLVNLYLSIYLSSVSGFY